jgi:hypothetical protein
MAFVPPAGDGAAPKRGLGAGAIIGIVAGVVVLVMLICGGVGVAVLMPALSKARDRDAAQQANTMREAMLLVQNIALYSMNNNDDLPSGRAWTSEIAAFFPDAATMQVALDSDRVDGAAPDYIYLPPPPRKGETVGKLSDIADPSTYIILHEDFTRMPARFQTVVVAMADGSVRTMERATLEAMLAAQKQAVPPAATDGTGGPG